MLGVGVCAPSEATMDLMRQCCLTSGQGTPGNGYCLGMKQPSTACFRTKEGSGIKTFFLCCREGAHSIMYSAAL